MGIANSMASPSRPVGRRLGDPWGGPARRPSFGYRGKVGVTGPHSKPSTGTPVRLRRSRDAGWWRGRAQPLWVSTVPWPGPRRRRPWGRRMGWGRHGGVGYRRHTGLPRSPHETTSQKSLERFAKGSTLLGTTRSVAPREPPRQPSTVEAGETTGSGEGGQLDDGYRLSLGPPSPPTSRWETPGPGVGEAPHLWISHGQWPPPAVPWNGVSEILGRSG